MITRPWPIKLLALFQLGTPLVNLILITVLFKINPIHFVLQSFKQNPIYFSFDFFGLYFFMAYAVWACKPWSYPVFSLAVIWNIAVTFQTYSKHPEQVSIGILVPAMLLNFILVGYFLSPNVRKLFFNSQLRWWESFPRFKVDLPVTVYINQVPYPATTQDLSEQGISFKLDTIVPRMIHKFDEIHVQFKILQTEFFILGLVVHQSSYGPNGSKQKLGLYFSQMDSETSKRLKIVTQSLALLGTPRTQAPPELMPSFYHWARSAVRGREWTPELHSSYSKNVIPQPQSHRKPQSDKAA